MKGFLMHIRAIYYYVSFFCFSPSLLLWCRCGGLGFLISTTLALTTRRLQTVITVWITWQKMRKCIISHETRKGILIPSEWSFCICISKQIYIQYYSKDCNVYSLPHLKSIPQYHNFEYFVQISPNQTATENCPWISGRGINNGRRNDFMINLH